METIRYQNLVIEAKPYQIRDSREWVVNFIIRDDNFEKLFNTSNSCPSRNEAIKRCFDFGKDVIDGKVKGCHFP